MWWPILSEQCAAEKKGSYLLYISNVRLPTEKAHGVQIVRMCQALAQHGVKVELVVPRRVQTAQMRRVRDLGAYYGIRQSFRLTRLPCLDLLFLDRFLPRPLGYLLFYVQALTFYFCAVFYGLLHQSRVVYSRGWLFFLLWLPWRGLKRATLVLEEHKFPARGGWGGRLHLAISRRVDRLVVLTRQLEELYVAASVSAERVLVAPDGVDMALFEPPLDRAQARRQLGLPLEGPIVGYAGHLYEWKGADVLVGAALYLPHVRFVIVGGLAEDRERLQVSIDEWHIENVRLVAHVPPAEVPAFLFAADVLVLPNSAREAISREYTSPLKMFQYMASQRPVVATDLPAMREVLRDGENAVLVEPDDPQALAQGIQRVLQTPDLTQRLAAQAYRDVTTLTWQHRAASILAFIGGD